MKRQVVYLHGCRTRPLAGYLKSVGVLRLVSHPPGDVGARGFWKGDVFCLHSSFSEQGLLRYFLDVYEPTPLVSPWNGGSGFYPKDQKKGIDSLAASPAPRFENYRQAIAAARALVGGRTASPKGEEKNALLVQAAQQWRGAVAEWLAAALVVDGAGEPQYPALLGTGGNDGRLDFTNNFMQRLSELFDLESAEGAATPIAAEHLRESLFNEPVPGLESVAIGQFDPGAAGGTNSSVGFATTSTVNLWDFVLMLEGAVAFSPALVRRASGEGLNAAKNPEAGLPLAAAPFAVFNAAAGYATAVAAEKSRGEQWMPLWEHPTTFAELATMLGQARCRVGNSPAKRPRDVARAIARAAVSRGFTGFERYAYLERNGQANLAIPLGTWQVSDPNPQAHLLDEIDEWVEQLERAANGKTAPASWARAARQINDAIMACCRPGATRAAWADLAQALGQAEVALVRNPQATAKSFVRPLFHSRKGLSPQWLLAVADRSTELRAAELRLAMALAAQGGPLKMPNHTFRVDRRDPIRKHFIPLAEQQHATATPHRFAANEDRLIVSNEVVVHDADPERELAELVRRRLLLLQRRNDLHYFPLVPTAGFEANLADLALWITGRLDSRRIVSLARMLMAIDWDAAWKIRREVGTAVGRPDNAQEREMVRRHTGWALTRLCFHWTEVWVDASRDPDRPRGASRHRVPCDTAVFARLRTGDGAAAVQLARKRLTASGVPARLSSVIAPRDQVRRWASSLVWSLSALSVNRLAQAVLNLAAIKPEPELEPEEPSPEAAERLSSTLPEKEVL